MRVTINPMVTMLIITHRAVVSMVTYGPYPLGCSLLERLIAGRRASQGVARRSVGIEISNMLDISQQSSIT